MANQSRDKPETLVGCEVETDYSILEAIAGFDILYPFLRLLRLKQTELLEPRECRPRESAQEYPQSSYLWEQNESNLKDEVFDLWYGRSSSNR